MKSPLIILTIFIVILIVISSAYLIFVKGDTKNTDKTSNEQTDTIAPTFTTITGDLTGVAGQTTLIATGFSDNIKVTSAKLYYRPATAVSWSSKSILNGQAQIDIPLSSQENWYYYITITDAANNGPVGKPSTDGSTYYTITVSADTTNTGDNTSPDENQQADQQDIHMGNNTIRHVFIEFGTRFVCSECPKVGALLDQMYKSGNYPFYYVSLPNTEQTAIDRLSQYNIYGYPTMYFDGGYGVQVGSTVQISDIEQKITDALARPVPKLSVELHANRTENTNQFMVNVLIKNEENSVYPGHLRVYLTEIVSTSGEGNTPQRFFFHEFLINEEIEISGNGQKQFSKTMSFDSLDPDNIMIFASVFNNEKQTRYSQTPDKNPFDAYYVDAVAATTVVQGGNVPPAVGIQTPKVSYFHRFGNPVRTSYLGKTILLGQTTILANASDDSAVSKVEFYINGKLMYTATTAPYEWTWNKLTVGKRTILVKAYDDHGKSSSATLNVFALVKMRNPLLNRLAPTTTATADASGESCH